MKFSKLVFTIMALVTLFSAVVYAATNETQKAEKGQNLNWIKGPNKASIGSMAEITLEPGYVALNGSDTRMLLESMHNLTSGKELALVGKTTADKNDMEYFAVYTFDDVGYVKDDEKSKLDADAMLKQIKENNIKGNEEKKKRGWETMTVVGWSIPPRYNSETHNLEWATKLKTEKGEEVVNFNTKYLGRHGVMKVILVCQPAKLDSTISDFQKAMKKYAFVKGNSYAEFTQGDKIAKYGLSALVVGGAAAVAAKSGFLKYGFKLIIAAAVAVAAFARKIYDKLRTFFGKSK